MTDKSDYQIKGEKSLSELNLESRVFLLESSLRHAIDYINLMGDAINVLLDETYGLDWENIPQPLKDAFDRYYS